MIKNLAILLGVPDYQAPNRSLPACSQDLLVMEALVRRGGVFQQVIVVPSTDSEDLKLELARIIARHEQEDIGQLFFYFTGHGDYTGEDFYYQLRDYDSKRHAQTSLSNSELDQMLKSLNPALLIKVVDACYSGVSYIKDGTNRLDSFKDIVKGEFPKAYFMFSSEAEQRSYADEHGSDFTSAFAKSIINHTSEEIRYKAIIDYLSDSFERGARQQPYFVSQANFTELFGAFSTEAKEDIEKMITRPDMNGKNDSTGEITEHTRNDEPMNVPPAKQISLLDVVQTAAQTYVTFEDAKEAIERMHVLLNSLPKDHDINQLFEIAVSFSANLDALTNGAHIGQWLKENASGKYFARPSYETEEYEVAANAFSVFLYSQGQDGKKIKKTRQVLTGISSQLSSEMPFSVCSLSLNPKFQNLTKYGADFTYLMSKTDIQIFYIFKEYVEFNWGKYSVKNYSDWIRVEVSYQNLDTLQATIEDFHSSFAKWVKERITLALDS